MHHHRTMPAPVHVSPFRIKQNARALPRVCRTPHALPAQVPDCRVRVLLRSPASGDSGITKNDWDARSTVTRTSRRRRQ
jgi:hypothetical protein